MPAVTLRGMILTVTKLFWFAPAPKLAGAAGYASLVSVGGLAAGNITPAVRFPRKTH